MRSDKLMTYLFRKGKGKRTVGIALYILTVCPMTNKQIKLYTVYRLRYDRISATNNSDNILKHFCLGLTDVHSAF